MKKTQGLEVMVVEMANDHEDNDKGENIILKREVLRKCI